MCSNCISVERILLEIRGKYGADMKIAVCSKQKENMQIKQWLRSAADADYFKLYLFSQKKQLLDSYQHQYYYDLILLDFSADLETARQIRQLDYHVRIIFLADAEQSVWSVFELDNAICLQRPLQQVDVCKTVQQYHKEFLQIHQEMLLPVYSDDGHREQRLFATRDILYMESHLRKVYIHTINHQRYELYGRISDLEQQLGPEKFFRTHKSCLVNLDYVIYVAADSIILYNPFQPTEIRLPLARRKREQLREQLRVVFQLTE